MHELLTDDDYTTLLPLQHDRLRHLFPAELQDAVLETSLDTSLIVACDWEAIALLNEDWDTFAHFTYLITGCDRTLFYVNEALVLTQTRAIELQQSASEASTMTVVAERTTEKQAKALKRMTTAAEEVVATAPTRTIADVLSELTDLLAAQTIAKIEARGTFMNGAAESTPEQAPDTAPDTRHPTPSKLPTVRLKGIYTPTASNFVQSAKRYLKAVDPIGDAARALKEIVSRTPTGLAHLERAVRAYPPDQQEKARTKLWTAFAKINDARNAD